MAQQIDTIANYRYEVRSPESCSVIDSEGIHLCTALPGCMAEFHGDGRPVTLSSDYARMRVVPRREDPQPWICLAVETQEASLILRHRIIYRAGELKALTLNNDMAADTMYCEICFTSGDTPTALSVPAEWKWFGDHLSDGVFVPQCNNRYRLVVLSDGVYIRAAAEGVAV